jgi:hypothetical protein
MVILRAVRLGGSEVELTEQTNRSDQDPTPGPEGIEERLKRYRLFRFLQELPTLPPSNDDIHFDPANERMNQFYLHAPVESLDDLKLWMGLPNDHIDHKKYRNHLRQVEVPKLTSVVGRDIVRVVDAQVIADAEQNLLFGYVDAELLRNEFWMAVAHGLLERLRNIYILVIQDLVVHDSQTVRFSNTQTAFFNSVTIYGSGRLDFGSDCKLIADSISYIPKLPVPDVTGGPDAGDATISG